MFELYRTRYKQVWYGLRKQVRAIIGYELWFTLIYMVVVVPLISWMLNKFLAVSGRVAVANEEIIAFLLSPKGIFFVLISLAFFLAFSYLERVGLMIIFAAAFQGKHMPVRRLLWIEFTHFLSIIRLGLLQAAIYIAVSLPFLALGILTFSTYLSEHDITYYMNARPAEWRTALAIGGVIVVLNLIIITYLYLRWLFSVPILIFEKFKPKEALKMSWQRTRSHALRLGVFLAAWLLLVMFLLFIFNVAFKMLFTFGLGYAGLKLAFVFPLVLFALILIGLSNLILFILRTGGHIFLITGFYLETAPDRIKVFDRERESKKKLPKFLVKLSWISACLILTLIIVGESFQLESFSLDRNIAVTAHRGSSQAAPENTKSALRQAVTDGADFAELDVQTTADGVVVLMHDGDLMRFASINRWIRDMEFEELRKIDIGSWFSDDFSHERAATLEEAMRYAEEHIQLNIELKYNRQDPLLAEKVGAIIGEHGFADKCVVSSTNSERLKEFRGLFPEVRSGPIILHALGNIRQIDADFLSISAVMATPRLIKQAHRDGKEIHVWTVNDLHTALAMIEAGVDNIITDRPAYIRNAIQTWNDFSVKQKVALWLRNLILDVDPDLVDEL